MANFEQLRAAENTAAEYQAVVNQRQQQIEQAQKNLASTQRILPVSKQVLLRTTAANRPQLAQAQIERTQQIANVQQQVAEEKAKQEQYKSELATFQQQISEAQAQERDADAYNAAVRAYEHRAPLMGYEGRERYWLQRLYSEGAILQEQQNKELQKLQAALPKGETLDIKSPEFLKGPGGSYEISTSRSNLPAIKSAVLGTTVPLKEYESKMKQYGIDKTVGEIKSAGYTPYYEGEDLMGYSTAAGNIVKFADTNKPATVPSHVDKTSWYSNFLSEQLPMQIYTNDKGEVVQSRYSSIVSPALDYVGNVFQGGIDKVKAATTDKIPTQIYTDNQGNIVESKYGAAISDIGKSLEGFGKYVYATSPRLQTMLTVAAPAAKMQISKDLMFSGKVIGATGKAIGSIPLVHIWGPAGGTDVKVSDFAVPALKYTGKIAGETWSKVTKRGVDPILIPLYTSEGKVVGPRASDVYAAQVQLQKDIETRGMDNPEYKRLIAEQEKIWLDKYANAVAQNKMSLSEAKKLYARDIKEYKDRLYGARYGFDPDSPVLSLKDAAGRAQALIDPWLLVGSKTNQFVLNPKDSLLGKAGKAAGVAAAVYGADLLLAGGGAAAKGTLAAASRFLPTTTKVVLEGAKLGLGVWGVAAGYEGIKHPGSLLEAGAAPILLAGGAYSLYGQGKEAVQWLGSGRKVIPWTARPITPGSELKMRVDKKYGQLSPAKMYEVTPSRWGRLTGEQSYFSRDFGAVSKSEIDKLATGLMNERGITRKAAMNILSTYNKPASIGPFTPTKGTGDVILKVKGPLIGKFYEDEIVTATQKVKYTTTPKVYTYKESEIAWVPKAEAPKYVKAWGAYTGYGAAPIKPEFLKGSFVTKEIGLLKDKAGLGITYKGAKPVDVYNYKDFEGNRVWLFEKPTTLAGKGKIVAVKGVVEPIRTDKYIDVVAPKKIQGQIDRLFKVQYYQAKSPIYYEKGTRETVDIGKIMFKKDPFRQLYQRESTVVPFPGTDSKVFELTSGRSYGQWSNTLSQKSKGIFTPAIQEETARTAGAVSRRGRTPFISPTDKIDKSFFSKFKGIVADVSTRMKKITFPKVDFFKTKPVEKAAPLTLGPDYFQAAKAEGSMYSLRRAPYGAGGGSLVIKMPEGQPFVMTPALKKYSAAINIAASKTQFQIAAPTFFPRTSQFYLPALKSKSLAIGALKLAPLLITGQEQIQVPRQITSPTYNVLQIPKSGEGTIQGTRLITTVNPPDVVIIKNVVTPEFKVPTPERYGAPEFPIVPIVDPNQFMKRKKKEPKRRGNRLFQTQVRVKGKYVPLPGFAVKGKALYKGEKAALASPIASFKIVPTKKMTLAPETKYKPSSFFFRSYSLSKGKQVQLKDEFIQRRRRRIWSTGEVAGTSWKGGQAVSTARGRKNKIARMSEWNRGPIKW